MNELLFILALKFNTDFKNFYHIENKKVCMSVDYIRELDTDTKKIRTVYFDCKYLK